MQSEQNGAPVSDRKRPSGPSPTTVTLGACTIDFDNGSVERADAETVLENKHVEVLRVLLERAPHLVTVEELLATVWPDVVVGDNVVHRAVSRVRRAFSDNPRQPQYIQTRSRRGYQWIGPMPELPRFEAASTGESDRGQRSWIGSRATLLAITSAVVFVAVLIHGLLPNTPTAPDVRNIYPPVAVWVAPFAAEPPQTDTVLPLEQLRRQLIVRLVKNHTAFTVAEESTAAAFHVSTAVSQADGVTQINISLIDIQRKERLWDTTFSQPDTAASFVHAPLAEHLVAQVSSIFALEKGAISLGTDPVAAREFALGHVEYFSMALGASGNPLVAIEHYKEALRVSPRFWLPEQMLTILYARRLGESAGLWALPSTFA